MKKRAKHHLLVFAMIQIRTRRILCVADDTVFNRSIVLKNQRHAHRNRARELDTGRRSHHVTRCPARLRKAALEDSAKALSRISRSEPLRNSARGPKSSADRAFRIFGLWASADSPRGTFGRVDTAPRHGRSGELSVQLKQ